MAFEAETAYEEEAPWAGLREVIGMTWPILLGALSFVLMDFVDKIFVSWLDRGLEHPVHLAAIGSAGVWAYTIGIFFVGVASCVSTFAAQSLGRGRPENCSRFTWQGIYISVVSGSAVLLIYPFSGALFDLMDHGPEVTALELEYFRIRILAFVFVAWQAALASFFQAIGKPVIPMYMTIAGNVSNIVLDALLIFGLLGFPELGIGGAAWATVISMAFQVVLLMAVFLMPEFDRAYRTRRTWGFDATKARDLFRIGWPAGLSEFLDVLNWSIFISFIVGQFGARQLAANTIAINFMHLTFIPAMALHLAVTPIVGKWIGRGDYARAKARAYTATKLGVVVMVTIGTFLAVTGPWLARVFSSDPDVIALSHLLLICAAVFAGFDAVNIVLIGALRGAGDTRWIMWALAIGSYAFCLPLAWTIAVVFNLQAIGAWMGATLYIIALSGVCFWRFHGETWREFKIFSEDRPQATVQPAGLTQEGEG